MGSRARPILLLATPSRGGDHRPRASQGLIGLKSFERLQQKLASGYQAGAAAGPSIRHGRAGQDFVQCSQPCILGGKPGVINLTVVEEDVPQLLSIGLLEHAKSVIDTDQSLIFFKSFGAQDQMNRLASGHRTVDVTKWHGGSFPIPDRLQEEFQLPSRVFDLSPSVASRAYMRAALVAGGGSSMRGR